MKFDPFVLPFSIGLFILFVIVIVKFSMWIRRLPADDRNRLNKGIFSRKVFGAGWEIITESLFHRRVYRVNPLLGYMHMSFAFGWFMLIVLGNLESRLHAGTELNFPYYPIFFRFFVPGHVNIPWSGFFGFIMDFFLLYVISGLMLAMFKRIYSRMFGMKKTTKMKLFDKFALTSLWFIFPLRLLAESFTSGVHHGGSFLTGSLGDFFAGFLPVEPLSYVAWWAYSFALGIFFVSLPYSRYMHIPAEILLIGFRRFGINRYKRFGVFQEVEINSCPRCGVCIDVCQISTAAGIHDTQAVYFVKSLREKKKDEVIAQTCLVCGRCKEYCPVAIDTDSLRLSQRTYLGGKKFFNYAYLPPVETKKVDVIYFAGCMTHLTPAIRKAMVGILDASGVNYSFMDADGSICCGRPLMLAGQYNDARNLIDQNKKIIQESGARRLVTSCPICFRVFNEDYKLDIEVLHHSQFISELLDNNILKSSISDKKVVYHDPCELGRGSGIFDEPRKVIRNYATLVQTPHEAEAGLCCGGSLGNIEKYNEVREKVSSQIVDELMNSCPDFLITSCPLCKKTLGKYAGTKVKDLAELVYEGHKNGLLIN
ncbi:MAG: (Fe-S)-binding protein [Bacteroidota bacterium]